MCGFDLPSAGPVAPFLPFALGLAISDPSDRSDLMRSEEENECDVSANELEFVRW